MLKPPKCLYIKHFGGFSTFRISHFPIQIQSTNHTFSDASFWMSFFEILAHPGAKTLDFGIPLAPSWAPNDAQNRPSAPKSLKKIVHGANFCWLASKIAFGTLLGTISSDFWWILIPFSMIFWIFNQILGSNLGLCFARRPERACWFITKI